jgi:hypothetical protein
LHGPVQFFSTTYEAKKATVTKRDLQEYYEFQNNRGFDFIASIEQEVSANGDRSSSFEPFPSKGRRFQRAIQMPRLISTWNSTAVNKPQFMKSSSGKHIKMSILLPSRYMARVYRRKGLILPLQSDDEVILDFNSPVAI